MKPCRFCEETKTDAKAEAKSAVAVVGPKPAMARFEILCEAISEAYAALSLTILDERIRAAIQSFDPMAWGQMQDAREKLEDAADEFGFVLS